MGRTLTYYLYRNEALIWSGTSTSYHDGDVTNDRTYVYSVAAGNAIGHGPNGTAISATPFTMAATPPGVPQGLTAVPGDESVTLSWSAPADNGSAEILGYYIYRGGTSGPLSLIGTTAALSYTDGNVSAGQTYRYQVCAYSSAGTGDPTPEVSVTLDEEGKTSSIDVMMVLGIALVVIVVIAAIFVVLRRKIGALVMFKA